jgi:lysyl-tRNA synthetase class 2
MSRIYQLCKAYRRGELGASHQPEFTMLEWYRAFCGAEQLMSDTERLAAALALALNGTTRIRGERGTIDLAPPWERLTVREAFARHAGVDVDALLSDEEAFFRTLVERVEPELGRERPVFLTHYPAGMAALARLLPDDPAHADRFEAYVDAIELCNGFGELTDAVEQRRRFEQDLMRRSREGRPLYPIDEGFLAALLEGLPDSAGNALGFDRLLMLLEGERDIARVVAFGAERS